VVDTGTFPSSGYPEVTGSPAPDGSADSGDECAPAFQWDVREGCEVRQILDRIADKWSLLVIALLETRMMRFTELKREIEGISQRMLTVTLRQLERDGLVCRTVHAEVPPRVEYCLSPMGHTLLGTIQALVAWTEEHQAEIARARAEFDARRAAAGRS
jgi:DNA-binding HxlR family transcriptional regulator